MNFFKSKQQQPDQTGDQIARTIADRIIQWQHLLAAKLNKRVNRYSKRRQKWLLWIFCGLFACSLIICLIIPFQNEVTTQDHNYQPVHIGLPSEVPTRPTDSLTTKK
ncbi:MAG: hypothetical protein JWP94_506 [Mucilaginibacter sp.]|nr:hypothetical protein [Mucilaginibacter sp.]